MKICYLASANSVHSTRWIKYFADKGHEIHWISLEQPLEQASNIKNVRFYILNRFSAKPLNVLANIFNIKQLVRSINPDILHSHYAGVYGLLGAMSGFHPFVLTAWGSDILIAGKSVITRPMIKFVLNYADLITCDAAHMERAIIELNVLRSKIKTIYFGVEIDKFQPGKKNETLAEELDVLGNKIVISLRSLEAIYDIETLIKAATFVIKEMPKTMFVIAGNGEREKKLKELSVEMGVEKKIRFVGRVSNDKLPEYLRLADVYVSTSLSDAGIAASTAEAMACGLPVVVTNSGENDIWIKNKQNGFVVPVKNPEKLAEMIIYLLKNDKERLLIGDNNQRLIASKNNHEKEMSKMEELYKSLGNH